MKKHIILSAFGTKTRKNNSSGSSATPYDHLDSYIKSKFPDSDVRWHFSSPVVEQEQSLERILQQISRNPANRIVVQSLHIAAGQEFHQTVRRITASAVTASVGLPLLASPDDHMRTARALAPLLDRGGSDAALIIGHGTFHPSWTTLPAFEQILQKTIGRNVFVAALEKYPSSGHVPDEIAARGFRRVLIIPLLITTGMHFARDITGNNPESWQNRLKSKGIETELHKEGLGKIDDIADIFCDHIKQAFGALPKEAR